MIWHVLTTRPRYELAARAELWRLGVEAVVPTVKHVRVGRGKMGRPILIASAHVLMPGYVIAGARDVMPWPEVNRLPQVTGWVRFDGRIATLTDADVDRIRLMARDAPRGGRGLEPGDSVTITKGPFASMTALIETLREGAVTVGVTLLGRHASLDLRPDMIETKVA